MKRATISIVSHGHGELVASLLGDLQDQHENETFDVVVTLNVPEAAPDPDKYPGLALRIRHNDRPLGFGANHNAALKSARTPWIVILNPDIRLPEPNTLATLLRKDADRTTGLRAPLIVNAAGEREDSVRGNLDPFSLLSRTLRGRLAAGRPPRSSPDGRRFFWLAGMFLCAPTDVFERVGGFDERYFLYCEDYDLSARIVRIGRELEVYDGTSAIHEARRSSHTSARYLTLHLRSLARVWLSPTFWILWAKDVRAAINDLRSR